MTGSANTTNSEAEFLRPPGVSQNRLAVAIGVPPRRINEIVHGKRRVTADTALRLARYFGTTNRFWLNLQTRHDLEIENWFGDAPVPAAGATQWTRDDGSGWTHPPTQTALSPVRRAWLRAGCAGPGAESPPSEGEAPTRGDVQADTREEPRPLDPGMRSQPIRSRPPGSAVVRSRWGTNWGEQSRTGANRVSWLHGWLHEPRQSEPPTRDVPLNCDDMSG